MAKKIERRWSVEKRLEFIDFRLFWEGSINRADIMNRFGISVPQSSTDLGEYQKIAPNNLRYDHKLKRYFAPEVFKPAFLKPDSDAYLWQMRDDAVAMSGVDGAWLPDLPSHDIVRMPRRHVDPNILKIVVASIRQKTSCEIFYQSMSSEGPESRLISPHALVFDGLRWHARGYCHKRDVFRDFLLARILQAKKGTVPAQPSDQDDRWNTFVTVSLIPHPGLTQSQAAAVAMDFNMAHGRLDVQMRAAFLYYFLHRLNLSDCDGRQNEPNKQHVVIADPKKLRAIYNSADYPL